MVDVPISTVREGHLLIQTSTTLISPGTEKMLVDFGKASLLGKARKQPDKVRLVIEKIKTDGIKPTIDSVFGQLDQPLPLGYCNVGKIIEVGAGITEFKVGERVASNGNHAEVVCVPKNLCVSIPSKVSDEAASFTVLGSIALQGIRLVEPTLGETIVVMGLGLVGLLTVQLLRAHGCKVIGIDMDKNRLALAQQFGAQTIDLSEDVDPVQAAIIHSRYRGVDAVIITASTESNLPIQQAAQMSRQRGRIVLIGVTGLNLSRENFFKKELSFQVSASYGPGRYDPQYEQYGNDYPIGFVRWTEKRNFEAVLDMIDEGRLNLDPLISHRFALEDFEKAYSLLDKPSCSMGIILKYSTKEISIENKTISLLSNKVSKSNTISRNKNDVSLSFIGSGNYASKVLIPSFNRAGVSFNCVSSRSGLSGIHLTQKYKFQSATTDLNMIFADKTTDAVVIATRHDSHASLILRALKSKKHVFVEKPLCLNLTELLEIKKTYTKICKSSSFVPILMVGFNRRFSPQIQKTKQLLINAKGPKSITMTINSGFIPKEHWTQDPITGGGRIIGEACHFIDLLRFLVDAPINSWHQVNMDEPMKDTVIIQLKFSDGSIGVINYFSNGSKSLAKERIEIFTSGRILQLNNFRKLTGFGWPGFKKYNLWRQDKGQDACTKEFVKAIKGGYKSPISFDEILEVSRTSIEIAENLN